MSTVDQPIPPEDIEVGHSVHVPRVNLSSERVDEIVLNEKGIPCVDEVDGDIVSDLEVTVQPEEPLEGAVHRVMESNGIEAVDRSRSKEILTVVGCEVQRLAKTWGSLLRSSTAATEEGKLSICMVSRTRFPRTHI